MSSRPFSLLLQLPERQEFKGGRSSRRAKLARSAKARAAPTMAPAAMLPLPHLVNCMSRKTGRSKRLRLYDRGNTACPICLTRFTRDQASRGRTVTLEHVPIKALGGKARCLTCKTCNSKAGSGIDQAAAMLGQDRFGVTVDILGKRDTFMLSLDGTALTQPFAGYSRQDWRDLEKAGSRTFSMSMRIPDAKAVAASLLRSAYLAIFSLLGPRFGYAYVQGDALTPIRQQIMDPLKHSAIAEYVIKAPDDGPRNDIALVSEPLACWLLKITDHLVVLPLGGDSRIRPPLKELGRMGEGSPIALSGSASWSFSSFGTFYTVPVHLAGADSSGSLLGLRIRGTLPNGHPLEGVCIRHAGESATLLCSRQAI